MNESSRPFLKKVSPKECTDTGMAMMLICLLAGWFTHNTNFYIATIPLLLVNMTWPKLFTPVAIIWLGFSHLLGNVMSKVILTLVFIFVQTPIALLRRIFGHDPMKLRQWKKGSDSVFESREHTYTAEELERPY